METRAFSYQKAAIRNLGDPSQVAMSIRATLQQYVIPANAYTANAILIFGSPIAEMPYFASSLDLQFSYAIENLKLAAVREFSAIPEVQSIYRAVRDGRVKFFVFTSEEVYDDALMDSLLDVQLRLSRQYPDLKQTYDFVASVLVDDPCYVTGSDSESVFVR